MTYNCQFQISFHIYLQPFNIPIGQIINLDCIDDIGPNAVNEMVIRLIIREFGYTPQSIENLL